MRQDDVQTWSAASLLLAMLMTVATVGTHTYRTATHPGMRGGTIGDRWPITYTAARVTGASASPARRVGPTPVPSGPRDPTGDGPRARSRALLLLILMVQGTRPTIGLSR